MKRVDELDGTISYRRATWPEIGDLEEGSRSYAEDRIMAWQYHEGAAA
jgi:hypothetical protein